MGTDQQLTAPAPQPERTGSLAKGKLGTFDIVFFVVSAAAPLTVAVSSAPLAFLVGGIGAPGAMLASGIVLILFAIGFTAMSRYVRNTGAFYAYASAGLGKPFGVGVAFITIAAYGALCLCFYAMLGFFANLTVSHLYGVDLHWAVWSVISVAIIGFLGYRRVDVGAYVLGVLLTLEVAILLIIGIAIIVQNGDSLAVTAAASFDPRNVLFASGASALFVFGFGAFLGFEGTVIYAEEAKRPRRTVPRATYIAIAFLAIFYAFTFWTLTAAFGVDGIIALAQSADLEQMTFIAGNNALGAWAGVVMEILVVTSFFACTLAFHNACSRYLFALGREGLLPKPLARTHPSLHSPFVASLTLSAICLVLILIGAVSGADPVLGIGLVSYSIGVAGLVFSQGVAAVSVVGFFWKDRRGHNVWQVVVAPILGAVGLLTAFTVIATHFDLVSGLTGPINYVLLGCVPLVFVGGIVVAIVMKRRAPNRYAALTQSVSVIDTDELEND
ncbi:APC family permease [Pseudoclavibacter chungangensis]|uniref:APC family permease n=1 Tax=Pseudoclavibacter chungangensis TaxID=587635 RepID=A0A7J5BQ72_9MICO|nr:APC family permease [Pseudoclavibacter chungangensis]KAB1653406.1 APC family permease [Pseudoclavibacter chungangensis]KAB1657230.1 APC family permease [Pseudoclavibacter chungangensis]NYJ66335.1 amino acid transporter [Pseudoclavibacter chungangensis]